MASKQDVESGRAFVRLFLKNDMARQLSGALKAAGSKLRSFGRDTMMAGAKMAGAGAALAAPLVLGMREFAKFDAQMGNVATMLDDPDKFMPGFRQGIKDMAVEFGKTKEDLATGLYDILSATVPPERAMERLAAATKLASAGNAQVGASVSTLNTLMDTYGDSFRDAGDAADFLFAIVERGRTNLTQLSGSLGSIISTAEAAGMSVEDMGASVALLTRATGQTDSALTALQAISGTFLKPGVEGAKLWKQKFGDAMDANTLKTIGMAGVLERLSKLDAGEVAKIFPNLRAIRGIFPAIAKMKGFGEDLKGMAERSGNVAVAFEKIKGPLFYWNQALEQGKNILLQIGEAMAGAITPYIKPILVIGKAVAEWVKNNKRLVVTIGAIAGGLVVAGTSLVAFGAVAWGAGMALTTLGKFVTVAMAPFRLLRSAVRSVGAMLKFTLSSALDVVKGAFSITANIISGTFTAALWGLKKVLSLLTIGFHAMVSAVTIGINVITGLSGAIASFVALGPVGIILALVAAFVAITTAAFGFTKIWTAATKEIKKGLDVAKQAVDGVGQAVKDIGHAVKNAGKTTGDAAASAGEKIRSGFAAGIEAAKRMLGRLIEDGKAGFRNLVADIGGSWQTLQDLITAGNLGEAWKLTLSIAKLEWVRFKQWLLGLWEEVKPTVDGAIATAADTLGNVLANVKIAWGNIWDALQGGLKSFLRVLDKAMDSAKKYIAMTQAFFGGEYDLSSGPPLELLVPGPRTKGQKEKDDAAAREQGKRVAQGVKDTLITEGKTPAEKEADTAARKKELEAAVKAHASALASAKEAAAKAKEARKEKENEEKEAAKKAAGGPAGPDALPGATATAAKRGVALTATYSAAAAQISGYQPTGPEEKMVAGIEKVAEKVEKLVAKAEEQKKVVEVSNQHMVRFLAGWEMT